MVLWCKSGRRCEYSDKKVVLDGVVGRSIFILVECEWLLNGSCCGLISLVVYLLG